jgi:hypothetical protein
MTSGVKPRRGWHYGVPLFGDRFRGPTITGLPGCTSSAGGARCRENPGPDSLTAPWSVANNRRLTREPDRPLVCVQTGDRGRASEAGSALLR